MSDTSAHEPGGKCRSCPVCLLVQAFQEARPDVQAHLVAAGRELALALRAALASERPSDMAPDDVSGDSERGRSSEASSDNEPGRPSDVMADTEPQRLRRIDIQ